jgi:hypothetical protein
MESIEHIWQKGTYTHLLISPSSITIKITGLHTTSTIFTVCCKQAIYQNDINLNSAHVKFSMHRKLIKFG